MLLIRLGLAFVFIYFGIDKFFNPDIWGSYVPSTFANLLPFNLNTFMYLNGIFEIIIAILLFPQKTRRSAALLSVLFLVGIIISLPWSEISVRDVGLLFMALALFFEKPKEVITPSS